MKKVLSKLERKMIDIKLELEKLENDFSMLNSLDNEKYLSQKRRLKNRYIALHAMQQRSSSHEGVIAKRENKLLSIIDAI